VPQPCLLLSPNFEQHQRRAYHEVLIAGDLSEDDLNKIEVNGFVPLHPDPDIAEFAYGNDAANTIYFAQPSVSQFVPGGAGPGTIDFWPIGLKDPLNNTFAVAGRNSTRNGTGAILRYASPPC